MSSCRTQSQIELKNNFKAFQKFAAKTSKDEWALILNEKVVAQGDDLKELLNQADKEFPGKKPMIARVSKKLQILCR